MCSTCGCGTTDHLVIQRVDQLSGDHKINGHSHEHHHHHEGHHHHHHHGHDHSHDHNHHHTSSIIEVERDILHKNDVMAARNRGFLEAKNIFALNLVSSPGSGKTSLLERTVSDMKEDFPICVIEGDQQSQNDANRIAACEVPVVQVNTGKGCHLDADMVHQALRQLNPEPEGFLFIENVGNLVCPSLFDLGENKRVVIISVTEGDDKPEKYPDMFHSSDICIVNKVDLLPYVQFDVEKMKQHALRVNPNLAFIELSATGGTGLDQWYEWLRAGLKK